MTQDESAMMTQSFFAVLLVVLYEKLTKRHHFDERRVAFSHPAHRKRQIHSLCPHRVKHAHPLTGDGASNPRLLPERK
jgi:hypothetical protein